MPKKKNIQGETTKILGHVTSKRKTVGNRYDGGGKKRKGQRMAGRTHMTRVHGL